MTFLRRNRNEWMEGDGIMISESPGISVVTTQYVDLVRRTHEDFL